MKNPEEEFVVCEEFDHDDGVSGTAPKQIYFGRLVARGGRDAVNTYSLKKRAYISTTSMDAELALLMANLALAAPGKMFYDPFVGTGSLVIACAHYGASVMGSDLDGRAVRGKGGRGVGWSLGTYGLGGRWVDGFVGDVTFSPVRGADGVGVDGEEGAWRRGGWLDGIVCDPPYGVREGLKVLGSRDGSGKEVVWIDGEMAHLYVNLPACRLRFTPSQAAIVLGIPQSHTRGKVRGDDSANTVQTRQIHPPETALQLRSAPLRHPRLRREHARRGREARDVDADGERGRGRVGGSGACGAGGGERVRAAVQ